MRILVVSDLHYRLRQLDWLAEVAIDIDVVVIAGDLLDLRSAVPLEAQAVALTAQLSAIDERTTLLVASGNHDIDGIDANGERAPTWLRDVGARGIPIDGASVTVGDVLFTICPWWEGPLGRAALEDQLALDAARRPAHWVWIHHAPPTGSPLAWDGRRAWGDDVVSGWIDRFGPDIVLSGHVHQAPFVPDGGWVHRSGSTWLFNAGSQHGPTPPNIVLDLGAGTATWTAASEQEEIVLATT